MGLQVHGGGQSGATEVVERKRWLWRQPAGVGAQTEKRWREEDGRAGKKSDMPIGFEVGATDLDAELGAAPCHVAATPIAMPSPARNLGAMTYGVETCYLGADPQGPKSGGGRWARMACGAPERERGAAGCGHGGVA